MKGLHYKIYFPFILTVSILVFSLPLCCCLTARAYAKTDIGAAKTCCPSNPVSFTEHLHECSCGCSLKATVEKDTSNDQPGKNTDQLPNAIQIVLTRPGLKNISPLSEQQCHSTDPPLFILNRVLRC